MKSSKDELEGEFCFTEEGRLRHENKYLQDRVTNLESFKAKFFQQQHQLVELKEKISILEQQVGLDQLKDRVFGDDPAQQSSSGPVQTENLLNFFQDSLLANTYQDLVASVFQSVEGLDVDVTVQINNNNSLLNHALDEAARDSNIQLIEQHGDKGETLELDEGFLINLSQLSLLAKYPPGTDTEYQNNLKNYLEIIARGTNTRIDTLAQRDELQDLRKKMYRVFKKTNQSFESMQDEADRQIIRISEMFLEYEKNLRDAIARMKLSNAYKELLDVIINDARAELNILLTSSLTLDEQFMAAMKKLELVYADEAGNE